MVGKGREKTGTSRLFLLGPSLSSLTKEAQELLAEEARMNC